MPSLRPLFRLLALLFALGQGLVPAVAATVDGRLAAEVRGDRDVVHIEQLGGSGCQRVHTDACDICRLLLLHAPLGRPPAATAVAWVETRAVPPRAVPRGVSADTPFALPRGPPPAA